MLLPGVTRLVRLVAARREAANRRLWETLCDLLDDEQRAALENYQPDEVGKLDNAIVEQRGASVLLLVPADADAAKTALDSLS